VDVQLSPEVQAKLDRLARETGRPREELVEDALIGYLDEIALAGESRPPL
jgi:predicted transcriptional regulator